MPLICKAIPCSFIRLHVTSNIRNNSRFQFSTDSKRFLFSGSAVQLLQPVHFLAIDVKFQVKNLPALEEIAFFCVNVRPVALFCVCDCCH